MKKTIIAAFSLTFLLVNLMSTAQDKSSDNLILREKNINRNFPSGGKKLSIDNSFGKVKVTTWQKSEIQVNIHITAQGSDATIADKVFNSISVDEKTNGNEISFKTDLSKNDIKCENCKTKMSIDYEVSIPANLPFTLENNFGNTELPDLSGLTSVTSKFGDLTAGSLPGLKKIRVEFGEADVKSVSNVNAVFKFSKIKVGNLGGKNDIKLEFCDVAQIMLDKNIGGLDMKESYSNVNIRLATNISATYKIETKFGTFIDRTNSNIKRTDEPDQYGPDSNKSYSGKSGSGAIKIDIDSHFGKIILGEPNADDMKAEKKAKAKVI